jgi:hypothetical protein
MPDEMHISGQSRHYKKTIGYVAVAERRSDNNTAKPVQIGIIVPM